MEQQVSIRSSDESACDLSTHAPQLANPQADRGSVAVYYSTKTYGNEVGLSCCFRQHRATHSHCRLLHGYSIGVRLTFACTELDDRGWVVDFGGLDELKKWLEQMFDHTVLVAEDDPHLNFFQSWGNTLRIIELRVIPRVGCEAFAQLIHEKASEVIAQGLNPTAWVKSVEVFEHGANSAIYEPAN